MGLTGVGKSTFINAAAGGDLTEVGHSLESCTTALTHVIAPYPYNRSHRIVHVDIPGFNNTDTRMEDTEILRRIVVLARSYTDKVKLAGIIYLYDIAQTRIEEVRRNFDASKTSWGVTAAQNVILGTTQCADVSPAVEASREQQLRDIWRDQEGFKMATFTGTSQCAWQIINAITHEQLPEDSKM
ncbi:hypothetical protein BV22DRAFT_1163791 [Leucogyrophana mollusca]|uniref:Uncharacterized protein n=1 Tax=Leucogyrophana mollusca TaxID=85980 RepID=A0ACB8BFQ1_9AGAM|nr:hypothetical protein BV22DRAFT_1163791 [Leucogyrophana mollusca]